jgi:hypothetical protein
MTLVVYSPQRWTKPQAGMVPMKTRLRGWLAIAPLMLAASLAQGQSKEPLLSSRTIRSGETFELSVDSAAPHQVKLRIHGGDLGNSGVEYFTTIEIRQWLLGRPQGPSPEAVLERAPSAGLGVRVKDSSAPLGDMRVGRALFVTSAGDGSDTAYAILFRNVPIPVRKQEVLQFLRDLKKGAEAAEALAKKKP